MNLSSLIPLLTYLVDPEVEINHAAVRAAPKDAPSVWSMNFQASTFAEGTDQVYYFILALDAIALVGITYAVIHFAMKYKRQSADQKTSSITHSGKLEFLWSAIPTVLLVIMFFMGEIRYMEQATPPVDAIDVRVTARQWAWSVEYPSYPGVRLNSSVKEPAVTLVVPKGKPVRLTMTSEDVIHSFFVPAFRVKKDVLPSRITTMWFEATRVGEYNLFCTEYCGKDHSRMTGKVVVLEPEDFDAKLAELGRLERKDGEDAAAFGKRVYSRFGCDACHTLDGRDSVGPTWKGIWGRTSSFTDGTSATVDENYVRESIELPEAKRVAGFAGKMPSFQGQMTEDQMSSLVEFMKTL